jgi:hypothetical protein
MPEPIWQQTFASFGASVKDLDAFSAVMDTSDEEPAACGERRVAGYDGTAADAALEGRRLKHSRGWLRQR